MKASFDFDGTLSDILVQRVVPLVQRAGFDVHIVTSRYDTQTAIEKFLDKRFSNDPIFQVAKSLHIPEQNIIFTNMKDKAEFFKENNGFMFHLDDDEIEVALINNQTKVLGILKDNENYWIDDIMKLLIAFE